MMGIFEQTTESETALYPLRDPEVIRLQAALQAACEAHAPAHAAWGEYLAAHCDESVTIPFGRERQRLYDALMDTGEAVAEAEAALRLTLDSATETATAAWDARIRRDFLADLPTIEAFIELLARHEALVIEAQVAGVGHVQKVSQIFLTSDEVRARLAYAKKALGIE